MSEQTFTPAVFYEDPRKALEWLERAFGFETTMVIEDPDNPDPAQSHYEMNLAGRGRIMVGGEWMEKVRSPRSTGGVNTQNLSVHLADGVDEHCERARAAGAEIIQEPQDEFYGDRSYKALDPDGHIWSFSMRVRDVSRDEAERAIGIPIKAADWA